MSCIVCHGESPVFAGITFLRPCFFVFFFIYFLHIVFCYAQGALTSQLHVELLHTDPTYALLVPRRQDRHDRVDTRNGLRRRNNKKNSAADVKLQSPKSRVLSRLFVLTLPRHFPISIILVWFFIDLRSDELPHRVHDRADGRSISPSSASTLMTTTTSRVLSSPRCRVCSRRRSQL